MAGVLGAKAAPKAEAGGTTEGLSGIACAAEVEKRGVGLRADDSSDESDSGRQRRNERNAGTEETHYKTESSPHDADTTKSALVMAIRGLQQDSQRVRDLWSQFATMEGDGVRDPARHPQEVLERFLAANALGPKANDKRSHTAAGKLDEALPDEDPSKHQNKQGKGQAQSNGEDGHLHWGEEQG